MRNYSVSQRAAAELELRRRRRLITEEEARAIDPLIDADPAGWIQEHFWIPELNAPIRLHDSQEVPLVEALRRDEAGSFVYSTVLWGAIKKSAKSSIAAAVGMWFAWRRRNSSIKVLGNDLDQAQSRVFEYMRRAVALNPDWRSLISVTQTKITLPNGSVIKAIPVDPQGEAGGGDDLLLYTELWGWKSKKHQQMWSESTLSPLLYGQSLRWCETYAGYDGESPVLEPLYDAGIKNGRVIDAEREIHTNDAGRLFVLWNTKPTLPWQTDDYYAQEATSLTPTEFRRLHKNEWGSSTDVFVYPEWWDACKGAFPDFARRPLVMAMDAAVSDDCFAIVGGHLMAGVLYPRFVRIWMPPAGGKIQYSNPLDPDDESTPEGYLRRMKRDHHLAFVTYDAYQLHDFASRMSVMLGVAFDAFSQGKDRAVADKMLYDSIRDQRIVHDGDDGLSEHVKNANRKADGDALRIVKRAQNRKIDAAVALSMLNYVCREVLIL